MKGHILKFNNTIILTLTCSSSMQIFDNMAEFLIDHKSSEVIKYYNGLCFDKNGVCLKTKCTCLKSGNSYSWIYKSRAIPKWQEFSCMINIRDDMNGIQYSVYTTLIYNGTGKTCSKYFDLLCLFLLQMLTQYRRKLPGILFPV